MGTSSSRRRVRLLAAGAVGVVLSSGCTASDLEVSASARPTLDRIEAIQRAVTAWSAADDLATAQAAAEEAANLVTGPDVAGYGDRDANGTTAGSTEAGLLPGESGSTPGIALGLADCAGPDLLGGDWSDPAMRWRVFGDTFARWAPGNNTFPTLPSHPQRVLGWAQLTLATDNLAQAREYSGHAQLHVDAAREALAGC